MTGIAPDGTHFSVFGPEQAPAVILIHGLGLNRQMWQWQVPALETSYRVVTYDLPGHGQTPPAEAQPSLTVFAHQLAGLLDRLKISEAVVVGFSLGGMIARRFAMDFPDRIRALGVLHSAHRRVGEEPDKVRARVDLVRREGPRATVEAALERWFSDEFRNRNPDVMDLVRGWVLANDKAVYPGNYQVLVNGVDELIAPDPPIDCPALVVTGTGDPGQTPEMADAIASEIAGSTLAILPGLRHMGFVEQPDVYDRLLLDFLKRAVSVE